MNHTLFEHTTRSGAAFSECRNYRYALWRIWDDRKPKVMFIGVNPSTANESTDDNTIKRVRLITTNWGYGGFYMMNLFAIVSRDPKILASNIDCISDNDEWLPHIAAKCDRVVFAWGNFKQAVERSKKVVQMFPGAYALHINKNGSPQHPLLVRGHVQPVFFNEVDDTP